MTFRTFLPEIVLKVVTEDLIVFIDWFDPPMMETGSPLSPRVVTFIT